MKKTIKYMVLSVFTLSSVAHASGFGGNGGCNDWPEWTPMYWMEKMMGDDDCYKGYGYGGYSPVPGYGSSYSPALGSGYGASSYSPLPRSGYAAPVAGSYSHSVYSSSSPYDFYNNSSYSSYSSPNYNSPYDGGSTYPQRGISSASYMPSPEEVYASDVRRRRLLELSDRRAVQEQRQRQYLMDSNKASLGRGNSFSSNRSYFPNGGMPMNMGGFGSPMSAASPMNMGGFGSPMSAASPMNMGGFGSPMSSMGMNPLSQGMMRPF